MAVLTRPRNSKFLRRQYIKRRRKLRSSVQQPKQITQDIPKVKGILERLGVPAPAAKFILRAIAYQLKNTGYSRLLKSILFAGASGIETANKARVESWVKQASALP